MSIDRTSKKGKILDIPNAPTIGTASDNGAVGATVEFTAATNGGPALSYTVISNPGSITSTGSTSPITVSGLSANTTYTFTVAAVNPTGTSTYSSASNSVTPVPLDYGALFPIQSYIVPSGGVSSVTFSNIPSTYAHLQIRILTKDNRASTTSDNNYLQFNNDTGSNYNGHQIYGTGAAAGAANIGLDSAAVYAIVPGASIGANIFGAAVIDIYDYASTNKQKVFRSLSGYDSNGDGSMRLYGGLWMSTSAITSIKLFTNNGAQSTIQQYSSFALYGVKA